MIIPSAQQITESDSLQTSNDNRLYDSGKLTSIYLYVVAAHLSGCRQKEISLGIPASLTDPRGRGTMVEQCGREFPKVVKLFPHYRHNRMTRSWPLAVDEGKPINKQTPAFLFNRRVK
jgi:hypothetical protein